MQFKFGKGLTTEVELRDMTLMSKGQWSRSQRNVTFPVKNAITQLRTGWSNQVHNWKLT